MLRVFLLVIYNTVSLPRKQSNFALICTKINAHYGIMIMFFFLMYLFVDLFCIAAILSIHHYAAWMGPFCESDVDGCDEISCYEGVDCFDVPAPGEGAMCGPCPVGFTGDGQKCLGMNHSQVMHLKSFYLLPNLMGQTVNYELCSSLQWPNFFILMVMEHFNLQQAFLYSVTWLKHFIVVYASLLLFLHQ